MQSSELETKYGMSDIGEKFMAGVLDHLPSILAVIAPLPNRLTFYSTSSN